MKRAAPARAVGIALPAEDAENDETVLHRPKPGSAAARNSSGGALCATAGGSFSSLLSGAADGQPGVANQMLEDGATKQHHSPRRSRGPLTTRSPADTQQRTPGKGPQALPQDRSAARSSGAQHRRRLVTHGTVGAARLLSPAPSPRQNVEPQPPVPSLELPAGVGGKSALSTGQTTARGSVSSALGAAEQPQQDVGANLR